jgi:CheY-like chemotaxis protein
MVLIVDDHKDTCEVLQRMLTRTGMPAEYALDAIQAMEAIHKTKPAVILLDQMMPGYTGFDLLRSLRENPRLKDIPVIFFSVVFDWSLYQKAMRLGAHRWFVKGAVPLTEVVDAVAACYARGEA